MQATNQRMELTMVCGGILGVLASFYAVFFSLVSDSYGVGSVWFVGVFGGILGIIGGIAIAKGYKQGFWLVSLSVIVGALGIGAIYIVPASLQLTGCLLWRIRFNERTPFSVISVLLLVLSVVLLCGMFFADWHLSGYGVMIVWIVFVAPIVGFLLSMFGKENAWQWIGLAGNFTAILVCSGFAFLDLLYIGF
ncbi:hypothetical protein [Aureibacillus halotolerans]|uniref:Uncharacterized protein n=1 Tax=Aureibacillus halotolerans TaxID=1508390 RepID=A0A4R6TU32_9BACI|nr:hypothetical protein [Aureibacillus halotolerans]TDQ37210.1 hypothetical protein EV213_11491 [Aureibacillus halotolerans]